MEKKSLEDWLLGEIFQGRRKALWMSQASADPPRNTRSDSDPEKLVSYGLSIGQVEQQIANNNTPTAAQLY